jgi:hypothetical protein
MSATDMIAHEIANNFWQGLFGFAILFFGLVLLAKLFDRGEPTDYEKLLKARAQNYGRFGLTLPIGIF